MGAPVDGIDLHPDSPQTPKRGRPRSRIVPVRATLHQDHMDLSSDEDLHADMDNGADRLYLINAGKGSFTYNFVENEEPSVRCSPQKEKLAVRCHKPLPTDKALPPITPERCPVRTPQKVDNAVQLWKDKLAWRERKALSSLGTSSGGFDRCEWETDLLMSNLLRNMVRALEDDCIFVFRRMTLSLGPASCAHPLCRYKSPRHLHSNSKCITIEKRVTNYNLTRATNVEIGGGEVPIWKRDLKEVKAYHKELVQMWFCVSCLESLWEMWDSPKREREGSPWEAIVKSVKGTRRDESFGSIDATLRMASGMTPTRSPRKTATSSSPPTGPMSNATLSKKRVHATPNPVLRRSPRHKAGAKDHEYSPSPRSTIRRVDSFDGASSSVPAYTNLQPNAKVSRRKSRNKRCDSVTSTFAAFNPPEAKVSQDTLTNLQQHARNANLPGSFAPHKELWCMCRTPADNLPVLQCDNLDCMVGKWHLLCLEDNDFDMPGRDQLRLTKRETWFCPVCVQFGGGPRDRTMTHEFDSKSI